MRETTGESQARPRGIFALFALVCMCVSAPVGADGACSADERQVSRLFELFDLSQEGLSAVRRTLVGGDRAGACRALLEHFRNRTSETAPVSAEKISEAERLLDGSITILNQEGRIVRRPDGMVDWLHRGPTDDREWASYLNRHGHLRTLLFAYLRTGEMAYGLRLDQDLADWIRSCPYPGARSESPDMRWFSLEPANRILVWTQVIGALGREVPISDSTLMLMLESLADHGHFLRHFHSPPDNHLLREMEALAILSTEFPEYKSAEEWLDYSRLKVAEWIDQQLYPDGVDRELSAFYHSIVLQRLASFGEVLFGHGVEPPGGFADSLERGFDYLARSMKPSGGLPRNNDGDQVDIRTLLLDAARRFDREDWIFIATSGQEGQEPLGRPSTFYPWAGQAILRSGWSSDDRWAFFDIGPSGVGSHQHADRLHLSIAAFGRDLLVDAGRYVYDKSSPWRSFFRGTSGHNLILVDGAGQVTSTRQATSPLGAAAFFASSSLEVARGHYVEGFEGVEGRAEHSRVVAFVQNELWLVVDRLSTDRKRTLRALWHFNPASRVEFDGGEIVTTDEDVGNLRIVPLAGPDWRSELVRGQEQPEIQGWWSDVYGKKQPATTAVLGGEINASATLVWLLRPARGPVAKGGAEVLAATNSLVTVRVQTSRGEMMVDLPIDEGTPVIRPLPEAELQDALAADPVPE